MTLAVSAKKARIFGLVGSILSIFLVLAPSFGGIVNLVGAALILIAVLSLSKHLKRRAIFVYFFIHVLALIGTSVLTGLTANYLLSAFESGNESITVRLLQISLVLLPMVSAFFFFKSYKLLGGESDVKMFSVTAVTQLIFAATSALLGLTLIYSQSQLVASLSLLITFLGYLAIPILGAVSYMMLSSSVINYRSRN